MAHHVCAPPRLKIDTDTKNGPYLENSKDHSKGSHHDNISSPICAHGAHAPFTPRPNEKWQQVTKQENRILGEISRQFNSHTI